MIPRLHLFAFGAALLAMLWHFSGRPDDYEPDEVETETGTVSSDEWLEQFEWFHRGDAPEVSLESDSKAEFMEWAKRARENPPVLTSPRRTP